jgi:hypothetical protein
MTKNQEPDAIVFVEVTMSLLHFPCHIAASRLSQRDSDSAPRATPQSLPLSLKEWPIKCHSMKEEVSPSSATRTGISNHWMPPSTSTQWQQADRSQTPKSQKSPSTTNTESEMEKTRILCIWEMAIASPRKVNGLRSNACETQTSTLTTIANKNRFNNSQKAIFSSCQQYKMPNGAGKEVGTIYDSIQQEAKETKVDHRFVLATIMQDSGGCVRVPTSNLGVCNPGLVQDHDGEATCNSDITHKVLDPCPN